jgi:hypothetical protein
LRNERFRYLVDVANIEGRKHNVGQRRSC